MLVLYTIEDGNKVYLRSFDKVESYTTNVEEAMKFEDDIEACSFLCMTGLGLNLEVIE